MDDRLRGRIREMAEQLVAEEKSTFRDARTLLDLEELTVEIGDELVRQLAQTDLAERGHSALCVFTQRRKGLQRDNPVQRVNARAKSECPCKECMTVQERTSERNCEVCNLTVQARGVLDSLESR